MSDLPKHKPASGGRMSDKHKPVDHRPFITGFDVAGFMDAINAEWRQREAAWKLELAAAEDQVTTLTERVSHLEERLEERQKNCSRNIDELNRIHEYLAELGKRHRRWWLGGMKDDAFGRCIGQDLLKMRDAWEKGRKWPWETDGSLDT